MDTIKSKIEVGITDPDDAARILIHTIDVLIIRQETIINVLKDLTKYNALLESEIREISKLE
jgi:hypothetical protein